MIMTGEMVRLWFLFAGEGWGCCLLGWVMKGATLAFGGSCYLLCVLGCLFSISQRDELLYVLGGFSYGDRIPRGVGFGSGQTV